ncbi:Flp family type IVb pilin [Microvirga aerophila]|uniref:Flp family type IVb pilin n=1 Tax=Microvirga aerophila TaxID=670291 RepID=A0A512C2J3_9HYPH|nr:Flp family type IVb pilin [Microvirga aerophila]GEO18247.1 hypothetical protein MAE02_59430 [Microvirga aerophila]
MAGVRPKWLCWQGFIRDEAGSTAVEYGLLAGLIGVATIGSLSAVGSSLNTSFQNTATSISSSPPAQGGTSTSSETGTSNNGNDSGNNGTTGTGSNGAETANGSNNSDSGGGTTGTGSNGTGTADSGNAGTGSNNSGNSPTPTTPPLPSPPPADPVVECQKDNKGKGAGSDKKCEA